MELVNFPTAISRPPHNLLGVALDSLWSSPPKTMLALSQTSMGFHTFLSAPIHSSLKKHPFTFPFLKRQPFTNFRHTRVTGLAGRPPRAHREVNDLLTPTSRPPHKLSQRHPGAVPTLVWSPPPKMMLMSPPPPPLPHRRPSSPCPASASWSITNGEEQHEHGPKLGAATAAQSWSWSSSSMTTTGRKGLGMVARA